MTVSVAEALKVRCLLLENVLTRDDLSRDVRAEYEADLKKARARLAEIAAHG